MVRISRQKEYAMYRLIVLCIIATMLIACQSVQHRSTDAMEVKKMGVNGSELSYVEEGKGDTVVFVHGASGDWRTWEGLRPIMSNKYHYVALSRRYHYPNAWADDGVNYTMTQHVEDVATFIRNLNAGKVHLVGASWGGRVAGYLVIRYPELIRSVILSDPALIAPVSADGKAALVAYQKDVGKSREAAKKRDARQAAILLYDAVQDEPDAFDKAPPVQQQRFLDNAKTLSPMYTGTAPPPVTCEQLAAIKVPVLVMSGEKTRAIFRYGNERLISCLPKGTATAMIPNSSHIWYPINPAGGAEAIIAFIAKH
jgi:pimeloyl-ACP methyl ester carboxylesterase